MIPFNNSAQSVILEIVFWMIAYLVYSNIAPNLFSNMLKSKDYYIKAKERKGVMTIDAQSEMIIMLTSGIHHCIAGLLMVVATYFDMPQLWRHGYLIETGFEIADLVAMNAKLYPYHDNSIKPELKKAMIFHHIPGVSLSLFVFQAGLDANTNMQSIGAWLLFAGGFSTFIQFYVYSLDFKTDLVKAAIANMSNVCFFIFARFYLFPKDVLALLQYVRATESISSLPGHYLLYVGASLMTLFNVAILGELVPKAIRYNQKAWDQIISKRRERLVASPSSSESNNRNLTGLPQEAAKNGQQIRRRRSSFRNSITSSDIGAVIGVPSLVGREKQA